MFLPLFIAILLGLVNPSASNTQSTNNTTTVSVNGDENPDPGDNPPGDDTGGESAHIPPKKP